MEHRNQDGRLFFDDFMPTWKPAMRNRMEERYIRIMRQQPQIIRGRRILDLGARDGRWTWAAIKTGAEHVVGIEGRAKSASLSKDRLSKIPSSKFELRIGDVFAELPKLAAEKRMFDTILCLGLFYHVYDHYALLKLMHALGPQIIVIDSLFTDTEWGVTRVHFYQTFHPNNAIADVQGQEFSPVGDPSTGLLRAMAGTLGYAVDYKDWSGTKSNEGITDYLERRRFTALLVQEGSDIYPIKNRISPNQAIERVKRAEKEILKITQLARDSTIPYEAIKIEEKERPERPKRLGKRGGANRMKRAINKPARKLRRLFAG
jgi:hypothetical protein